MVAKSPEPHLHHLPMDPMCAESLFASRTAQLTSSSLFVISWKCGCIHEMTANAHRTSKQIAVLKGC